MSASDFIYRMGDTLHNLLRKVLGMLQWFTGGKSMAEWVDSAIGPSPSGISTQEDIVVSTPGVAVQGASMKCNRGALVVASPDNTGRVYVGGPTTTNGSGNRRGAVLTQGGMPSQFFAITNTDQIFVNADEANDRVSIIVI